MASILFQKLYFSMEIFNLEQNAVLQHAGQWEDVTLMAVGIGPVLQYGQ
ncbi:hypothetical protein ACLB90_16405 [Stenotrophomonas sp. LGBM10]